MRNWRPQVDPQLGDALWLCGDAAPLQRGDHVPPSADRTPAGTGPVGVDVLVCHLRLVQTGLDLVDFPTTVWFEADCSVYTMRQASRRSWRIGQTQPVQVVFMAYRNTLQADALKLDVSRAGPTWWG